VILSGCGGGCECFTAQHVEFSLEALVGVGGVLGAALGAGCADFGGFDLASRLFLNLRNPLFGFGCLCGDLRIFFSKAVGYPCYVHLRVSNALLGGLNGFLKHPIRWNPLHCAHFPVFSIFLVFAIPAQKFARDMQPGRDGAHQRACKHKRPQGEQSIHAVEHFDFAPEVTRTPGDQQGVAQSDMHQPAAQQECAQDQADPSQSASHGLSPEVDQGDVGPEVAHFLGNGLQGLFLAQSRALQLVQAFLGVAVAETVSTPRPAQGALGGGAEGVGPALSARQVVVLRVVNTPVGETLGFGEAALFEGLGKIGREPDFADQTAFADHRVGHAVTSRPFAGEGRTEVGGAFGQGLQGKQFVGAQTGVVGDVGGQGVAGGLGLGDELDLGRGVGASGERWGRGSFDHGEPFAGGQLAGDVVHHGLDRLPFHVQGFLFDRWTALFEVLDGLCGGESAETAEALVAGVFGDAGQGLFVVAHGADRGEDPALQALHDPGGLPGRGGEFSHFFAASG